MFPEMGKSGNIDRKHNVTATMFREVGNSENNGRKFNVSSTMFSSLSSDLFIFIILICIGLTGCCVTKVWWFWREIKFGGPGRWKMSFRK